MIKIGPIKYKKYLKFAKSHIYRVLGASKDKSDFWLFFNREELLKKGVLHYKPCQLTSLSSRKSWDIFAVSSEKIDFFIFDYTNFRVHFKKVIHPKGYVRFGSNFFSHSLWKNFCPLLSNRGDPYQKKVEIFFSSDMTIYTPIENPCRVYRKYVASKFFKLVSVQGL